MPNQIKSIHNRHGNIHQQKIRLEAGKDFYSRRHIGCGNNINGKRDFPAVFDHHFYTIQNDELIIYNHDFKHGFPFFQIKLFYCV